MKVFSHKGFDKELNNRLGVNNKKYFFKKYHLLWIYYVNFY